MDEAVRPPDQAWSNSPSSNSCTKCYNVGQLESSVEIIATANTQTLSKSCDDLFQEGKEDIIRSQSCRSLNSDSSQCHGKYNHIQSNIKQYIDVLNKNSSKCDAIEKAMDLNKEAYLEEINLRLSRELDEKNAMLNQLQQNYEHLLLKYAEAQNKIDNLRMQAFKLENVDTCEKSKPLRKQITCAPIYPCNVPPVDCQRTNFTKTGPGTKSETCTDRPSTLAVDGCLNVFERDDLKVVTPTDSEGVSSVVTSMSGHSKIINNFEQPSEEANDSSASLKSDILEKALESSDPFDKVKNWQNSLPPLEMIETPDTALYDMGPDTPSTMYNELPVSELTSISENPDQKSKQVQSQAVMKKYLRTLSLPTSLTRKNMLSQIYKRRNNHTIDMSSSLILETAPPPHNTPPQNSVNIPSSRESQPARMFLRRKKRPPFLRSASLPAYNWETPRCDSQIIVPPLNLDSLTFSEDEISPGKNTSGSLLSSQDYSFQTTESQNACKATLSEFSGSSFCRSKEQRMPAECKSMSLSQVSEGIGHGSECCNVCGESVLNVKPVPSQLQQDISFVGSVSLHKSTSFHSESIPPSQVFLNEVDDTSEAFDSYATNLKARSDIILKALTAHVKHS